MRGAKVDLHHLRHFVAVAEEQHFTRAALRAGIEQSPLSRSIAALEKRLGVALFVRSRRTTRMTPAGERLLLHARSLLAAVDEAIVDVRSHASESSHLHIGVCDAVPAPRLARLLVKLRQDQPSMTVHLHDVPMIWQLHYLRAGFLDAVIGPASGYGKDIVAEVVWRDTPVAMVPRGYPLAEKSEIGLDEVVREPLVFWRPDTGLGRRSQIEQLIRAERAVPDVVHVAPTLCMLFTLVVAGCGVGFSTAAHLEAVDFELLAVRSLYDVPAMVKTWLLVRDEPVPNLLALFVDRVRAIT